MSKKNNILERRKKWIEALRSEKYTQGKQYLFHGGKYCCWGVACETFAEPLKLKKELNVYGKQTWDGYSQDPPHNLIFYLGMTSEMMRMLISLNDTCGLTFSKIAQIIEHLEVIIPE